MKNLFDLDFSRWGSTSITFVPAIINFGIFLYISFFLPRRRTNSSFSVFVFLLGMWQLANGFMRLSISAEAAYEWIKIEEVLLALLIPLGILFVLYFSEWYKKIPNNLTFPLLFLPTIISLFFIIARLNDLAIVKTENWHWVSNPKPTVISLLVYGWYAIGSSGMLILLWLFYALTRKDKGTRISALLLAFGFSVPAIAGVIVEIIFPIALGYNDIPLTAPLVTVFSIAALVAIIKYKFLSFSPKYQWDTIVESMNEGILIVNNKGQIMYANKILCKLLEYEFEEMKGKSTGEIFLNAPDQIKPLKHQRKTKTGNQSSQYEIQIKTKSGKIIWMIVNNSPYTDSRGKKIGSIGIHTNITERKNAEEELRKSEEKHRDIVENISDIICTHDLEGRILSVNSAAVKLLGYESPVLLKLTIQDILAPGVKHLYSGFISTITKNGYSKGLMKVQTSAGVMRFWEYSNTLRTFQGKPIVQALARDVTESKKAFDKIVEAENQIRNFAKHLNKVMEDERANIAREIHDELGQQLSGIKINLALYKKLYRADPVNEKIVSDLITDIDNTMQSLRKISTQLRPGILDTLGLIPSIRWLAEEFEKHSKIKCQVEMNSNRDMFEKDISTCFFRICQEALTNISKHAQASEVIIQINQNQNELALKISDNGKGITNEKLANPFSMGLLGMRERANIIGANLHISSQKDLGTTVQLQTQLN
jgi:PAS domain S-box-containing protein